MITLALGLTAISTVTGLRWFHARRSAGPLDLGLMAYARGDYSDGFHRTGERPGQQGMFCFFQHLAGRRSPLPRDIG